MRQVNFTKKEFLPIYKVVDLHAVEKNQTENLKKLKCDNGENRNETVAFFGIFGVS